MIVKTILKQKTSNEVATTSGDQSIEEAAKLLHHHHIGAVVVTGADCAIAGILSERDIVRGMALQGDRVEKLKVSDLMTTNVLVCSPNDSLEKLMAVMTTNHIRHLPVVENDRMFGIITIGDVVKARLDDTTMQVDSLREYVMAAR
jgi:CBS domain-containing protein